MNEDKFQGRKFEDVSDEVLAAEFPIDYRYSEDQALRDIKEYVDSTYAGKDSHYSRSKTEMAEVIIDAGYGMAFMLGNVLKYGQRYGKKGGFNRKDLMKVIHYGIMALHVHDNEAENDCYIDEDKKTG